MTREEAIEQLQDAKDGYKEYLSNDALDIAIKALEYPEKNVVAVVPCGDCISRADTRSLICKIDLKHHVFGMSRKTFKDLYNGIDELPSVAPQEPRWIPVSERLPEENMDVLVVVEFPDGKDGTLQRIEIASFGSMYHLSSEKGWITNNFTRIARTEVKAWMPLLKQYESQESEGNK